MDLLKISAVSYLNTFPFVYGLQQSGFLKNFRLELDIPSVCAEKLKNKIVDIALVPAGALPDFKAFHYISDYCIGAVSPVKTVLLLSKVPLEMITKVHLDFDSRTSVRLVKVLAGNYWQITPAWENLKAGEASNRSSVESLVAIGDKTFELRQHFPYIYDMAEEWIRFTGLPFVFAVWLSREQLADRIVNTFTQALTFGVTHKRECIEYFRDRLPACDDCLEYLEHNISYSFDDQKKEGLARFLKYL
ncbi:MAG: menaquinone biosynthesis protein [Bacteroidales bacterium]|jgi:chorismate dehydratase|nr:menaquinone biosynthesis protein [Bacteroidales bacterium]